MKSTTHTQPLPTPSPAIQWEPLGRWGHDGSFTFKPVHDRGRSRLAVLDKADADHLQRLGVLQVAWHMGDNGTGTRYVRAKVDGMKRQVARIIANNPPRHRIGYRSGNRLDLRRDNLQHGTTKRREGVEWGAPGAWEFVPSPDSPSSAPEASL